MLKHLMISGALSKDSTILHYFGATLLIVCIVFGIGDTVYSLSFYIASQVYGQFDEFQQGQVNCSSSVYYSSFVSVVIVFNYIFIEIVFTAQTRLSWQVSLLITNNFMLARAIPVCINRINSYFIDY
jgi:hypothetical protein